MLKNAMILSVGLIMGMFIVVTCTTPGDSAGSGTSDTVGFDIQAGGDAHAQEVGPTGQACKQWEVRRFERSESALNAGLELPKCAWSG